MVKQTARNGKIEWMRFVFSVIIIIFHCKRTFGPEKIHFLGYHGPYLMRGFIGVEFFFLLTGYLMARSIAKTHARIKSGELTDFDLGKDSLHFMIKKYWGIFPYHIFSFSVLWLLRIFTREIWRKGAGAVVFFGIESFPEFFLLQRFGFDYVNIDVVEWYLSAMLIALMVLYPLAFRFYSVYVRVVGPFIALWILGVMQYINGTFSGQDAWMGFGYVCVFRAFAEMTLGMGTFLFAEYLRSHSLKKETRILLTVVEFTGYLLAALFGFSGLPGYFEPQILILLWLSVGLSFSGQTLCNELFQNDVIFWLGRFSLPLYLCQLIGTAFVNKFVTKPPFITRSLIAMAIILVMALMCQAFGDRLNKAVKRRSKK